MNKVNNFAGKIIIKKISMINIKIVWNWNYWIQNLEIIRIRQFLEEILKDNKNILRLQIWHRYKKIIKLKIHLDLKIHNFLMSLIIYLWI